MFGNDNPPKINTDLTRFPCPCTASREVKCTKHDPPLHDRVGRPLPAPKINIPKLVPYGDRKIAWDRKETDPCQRSTPGCSVDHEPGSDWSCDTW